MSKNYFLEIFNVRKFSLIVVMFLVMFLSVAQIPTASADWPVKNDLGVSCSEPSQKAIAYSGWTNTVHVVCGDQNGLYHTFYNGTQWSTPVIVDSAPADYASISVNMVGWVYVSYYSNGVLKFAQRGSSSWSTPVTLDNSADVGKYSSIVAVADTEVHISYYDATNRKLKYKKKIGMVWYAPEVVDSVVGTGKYSSIALKAGLPQISYYYENGSSRAIKFAYKTSSTSTFTRLVVDSNTTGLGNYAGWTSLAMDSSGIPHISYHRGSNGAVMHAYKPLSQAWQREPVDSQAGYEPNTENGFTSIAIDSNNVIHISYRAYNGAGWLKYANKATGQWVPTNVDTTTNTGEYTSIALGQAGTGTIHISYLDVNGELRYARNNP